MTMKNSHTYIPCTVRSLAAVPTMVLCGSVVTDIPIVVSDSGIVVEDLKSGFTNADGTDFKDLSFE